MSYETAPATELVATHCAACGKELVDAISVETGLGPTCRKRHGYSEAQTAPDWDAAHEALDGHQLPTSATEWWRIDARKVANILIHRVAVLQEGVFAEAYTATICALGFRKVAEAIATNLGAVRVETAGDELLVRGPFSEAFNHEVRRCQGQRWDPTRRARVVPSRERASLWVALKRAFPPGTLVVGARKISTI